MAIVWDAMFFIKIWLGMWLLIVVAWQLSEVLKQDIAEAEL